MKGIAELHMHVQPLAGPMCDVFVHTLLRSGYIAELVKAWVELVITLPLYLCMIISFRWCADASQNLDKCSLFILEIVHKRPSATVQPGGCRLKSMMWLQIASTTDFLI